MAKPIKKTRFILPGNRALGSLLYFKDRDQRYCLKLSFKNKVSPTRIWKENLESKEITNSIDSQISQSIDISYKFVDSILEIKTESIGNKPTPRFIKVPNPPQSNLFFIRIKDWQGLEEVKVKEEDLLLEPPTPFKSIAVIFSFSSQIHKPFMAAEYAKNINGRTKCYEIPFQNFPYDKLWVGITEDSQPEIEFNLAIKVPVYSLK